jgi:hypothetical protein
MMTAATATVTAVMSATMTRVTAVAVVTATMAALATKATMVAIDNNQL